MTQLSGASRIVNDLGLHGSSQGDAQMVEQLKLYKTPAIIRDMKEVFFYVQAFANSTNESPYTIFTNKDHVYVAGTNPPNGEPPGAFIDPFRVPSYYCPIGTKRKFRIWEQVNSLLDVRIPKDKYFFEINLIDAQVESDPSNWVKQRDLAQQKMPSVAGNQYTLDRMYNIEYEYEPIPAQGGTQNINSTFYKEALKQSTPQPLFVRIPQLDNGQAYNWTVVNNGAYNEDKNHQMIVRHGDIAFQELDLEFGHLTYQGVDNEYEQFGKTQVKPNAPEWNTALAGDKVKNDISNYQRYTYLDYNWSWPNAESIDSAETNVNNEYIVPASRNEWLLQNDDVIIPNAVSTPRILQGRELKTNQQAANITFKFKVRLIHLF